MAHLEMQTGLVDGVETAEFERAYQEFNASYPGYGAGGSLDELRRTQYGRLDDLGQIYLDYTGGGLYSEEQVRSHSQLLLSQVFGNPHSSNPTSQAMTILVESARRAVLEYFCASQDEYVCIFTANATGALKLVGESYPFTSGARFLLTFDNHNSVNGIREYARARGAQVTYIPVLPPDLRIDAPRLEQELLAANSRANHLFAFPAQSNFSGVQHSLDWINKAQSLGWDVLLDAAAFVPTNRLDLSQVHPDFVSLSFYKMFGYPTGVGALLARRAALEKLHRPWFAGGTITVASVQGDRYFLRGGAEGFEDGTLSYLILPAVEIGLRHMADVGVEKIHQRVSSLTAWLLHELHRLQHSNGKPLVRIYGPVDLERRGGTITMNFFDPDGHFIDHLKVEELASRESISLRTGCFCNPGGGEMALGLSADQLTSCFAHRERMEYPDFQRCIDDRSTGAVRASLGLVSNFRDAWALACFAQGLLDKKFSSI